MFSHILRINSERLEKDKWNLIHNLKIFLEPNYSKVRSIERFPWIRYAKEDSFPLNVYLCNGEFKGQVFNPPNIIFSKNKVTFSSVELPFLTTIKAFIVDYIYQTDTKSHTSLYHFDNMFDKKEFIPTKDEVCIASSDYKNDSSRIMYYAKFDDDFVSSDQITLDTFGEHINFKLVIFQKNTIVKISHRHPWETSSSARTIEIPEGSIAIAIPINDTYKILSLNLAITSEHLGQIKMHFRANGSSFRDLVSIIPTTDNYLMAARLLPGENTSLAYEHSPKSSQEIDKKGIRELAANVYDFGVSGKEDRFTDTSQRDFMNIELYHDNASSQLKDFLLQRQLDVFVNDYSGTQWGKYLMYVNKIGEENSLFQYEEMRDCMNF